MVVGYIRCASEGFTKELLQSLDGVQWWLGYWTTEGCCNMFQCWSQPNATMNASTVFEAREYVQRGSLPSIYVKTHAVQGNYTWFFTKFRPYSATCGLVLIDPVFATYLLWFDVPGMVMMLGLALRQLRLQIQWLDGKGGNQFKSSNHWICCVMALQWHTWISICVMTGFGLQFFSTCFCNQFGIYCQSGQSLVAWNLLSFNILFTWIIEDLPPAIRLFVGWLVVPCAAVA